MGMLKSTNEKFVPLGSRFDAPRGYRYQSFRNADMWYKGASAHCFYKLGNQYD
jgi:hypothetical protein